MSILNAIKSLYPYKPGGFENIVFRYVDEFMGVGSEDMDRIIVPIIESMRNYKKSSFTISGLEFYVSYRILRVIKNNEEYALEIISDTNAYRKAMPYNDVIRELHNLLLLKNDPDLDSWDSDINGIFLEISEENSIVPDDKTDVITVKKHITNNKTNYEIQSLLLDNQAFKANEELIKNNKNNINSPEKKNYSNLLELLSVRSPKPLKSFDGVSFRFDFMRLTPDEERYFKDIVPILGFLRKKDFEFASFKLNFELRPDRIGSIQTAQEDGGRYVVEIAVIHGDDSKRYFRTYCDNLDEVTILMSSVIVFSGKPDISNWEDITQEVEQDQGETDNDVQGTFTTFEIMFDDSSYTITQKIFERKKTEEAETNSKELLE